jgi:hypothetical protein
MRSEVALMVGNGAARAVDVAVMFCRGDALSVLFPGSRHAPRLLLGAVVPAAPGDGLGTVSDFENDSTENSEADNEEDSEQDTEQDKKVSDGEQLAASTARDSMQETVPSCVMRHGRNRARS